MLSTIEILDVLEEYLPDIQVGLGPDWVEFSRRVSHLANRFKAIAAEDDPAPGKLQAVLDNLLEICQDYTYVAGLLGLGSRRPPSPQAPDLFEVKEVANRYYSLLVQLKETEQEAAAAKAFKFGYALLIGVNKNTVSSWVLPSVAKDIHALTEVLIHPHRCAYLKDNVKTITDEQATRHGILDGLDWLDERLRADTSGNATVIVYYSGHGWRDISGVSPDYYFIPYDVKQDQIRSRSLRAVDFAERVGALKPKRLLVILDCCHAGGMGVKGEGSLPASYVETAISPSLLMAGEKTLVGPGAEGLETLMQGSGRAVLSSSTSEQPSYMRRDDKMGIFTYHLIEALTGHAQPAEGATEVLVSDVMSHVWRHVPASARADWNADQQPDYQVSGNFPIALLLGGKGLSPGRPAPDPLVKSTEEETVKVGNKIDTDGGAYIRGRIDIGDGDFVGRDEIIHGDMVYGDKVMGDKIHEDNKITTGNIAGTNIVIGHGIYFTASDEITELFTYIFGQIKARSEEIDVDKEKLVVIIQQIQYEVRKGDRIDITGFERKLKSLAMLAPDIFKVTVEILTHSNTVASIIRNIAKKAKADISA